MSTRPSKPNARQIALDLLQQVLVAHRPLDDALARDRAWARLSRRDRAFARLLTITVLRRLGQLDALIDTLMERPLKPRQAELRNILRLGAAQLLILGTPPHAAVSTSLDLAERGGRLAGFKGLISAVLHRLSRDGEALLAEQDAARLSLPDWLWQRWSDTYGEATTRAVAEELLIEAPLDLTVKEKPDTWARRLEGKALPWGSVRLDAHRGEITNLPGFKDGAWWVQDAAAALTVRFLGSLEGKVAIDLCAAPGGKTAALAVAGAEVTAVDRSAARMERLKQNMTRLKLPVRSVVADALQWRPGALADLVVLDAPCSATGTLRRHPDIKHLKGPEEIESLAQLQDNLLAAAAEMVAPGGTLLYIVCSLEPEEGPAQVEAFLGKNAAFARRALRSEEIFGLDEVIDDRGDFRSLPCHLATEGGLDGFYLCRLERLPRI
jgi:16S rRNA (cytosine967-C5)-methyltransferase